MTPELLALAAAVTALPGWRWMPGMLATGTRGPRGGYKRARVENTFADCETPKCVDTHGRRVPAHYACMCEPSDVTPDLTDAATGGCMWAMLGPLPISPRPGGIMAENPETPGFGSLGATLAEACARVALARGRWS